MFFHYEVRFWKKQTVIRNELDRLEAKAIKTGSVDENFEEEEILLKFKDKI